MWKEFKAFALRGNMLDLAVGIIIGATFNAVVNSLVSDVIMNFIAAIVGKPDFSELVVTIGKTPIRYGNLVTALVNFLLIAFVLFMIVRGVNRLTRPKGAAPESMKMRECPFCTTAIPVKARRCLACTSEVEPQAA